jgi:transcriptional regulator with GAF, ATPase, and Fis domain
MKGFATNSSTSERVEMGPKETSQGPKFIPPRRLVDSGNQSEPFDPRISYLKILALSLLREIASVENTNEGQGNNTIDLQSEVRRFETELIRCALIQTGGRQRRAARLLGTKVTTLNTKIKRYNIKLSDEATSRTDLE